MLKYCWVKVPVVVESHGSMTGGHNKTRKALSKKQLTHKMKNLLSFCFLFLTIQALFAQDLVYKTGDQLYVFAKSGLNLRAETSISSDVISKINYGESIEIIGPTDHYDLIEHRKGIWLAVSYQNQIGYLFSGYLSKWSPPHLDIEQMQCHYHHPIKTWITSLLANDSIVNKGERKLWGYELDGKDAYRAVSTSYQNGTLVNDYYGYESYQFAIESFDLTMNDWLNFIEYYISKLKEKCEETRYFEKPKLKIKLHPHAQNVSEIECPQIGNFTVKKIGLKSFCSIYLSWI